MNLHDLFAIPRNRTPAKVALEYVDDAGQTQQTTYAQLYSQVDALAAGLQKWGLRKGDRVAFYLNNRLEFVVSYLAVLRVGAIMVPVNLRYRRLEIAHILDDSAPRLIITERAQLPILDELQPAEKASVEAILLAEEMDGWLADVAALNPPVVEADDLGLIMYTSGTTGRSKGAMITHNNVIATVTGLMSAWAWQPEDVLLLCLPLFHTHGLVVGLHCALAMGATVLLREKYEAAKTVADLNSGRPTLFFAVPTIYVRLIDELKKTPQLALQNMRLFCSGSAPLAAETHAEFESITGHIILERYGMTETGMNLSNPYAGPRLAGTVGTPLPGVSMRIVTEAEAGGWQDVAAGAEGELLVRGSNVFSGYWQAPEKTASFSHDALGQRWFTPGDLARQEPQSGYVTLLGRRHSSHQRRPVSIREVEMRSLSPAYLGCRQRLTRTRQMGRSAGSLPGLQWDHRRSRSPRLLSPAARQLQNASLSLCGVAAAQHHG
ncbi:MAG: AMP-binding protein [Caldilineaceae bacterium]